MQKRNTKNSDKDKPSWDWTQVECTLKINEASKKSMVWNLAPTIILTNPTSQYSDPNVRLYIDTQKSLQYSPELGWNWHKSWNLPNISIRLQIKDQNTGQLLLAPKNLFAQMFAVKKSCDNDRSDHMSLVDVGIRGDGKMEMIDGQVYFSAMKFSSTTYNNQGMNFNLLIVMYINEEGNDKPKILTAVMSPGIFVDSRRSARDYQQKKFNSFIEPFLYQNLEKQYIKRQNKSKTQSQIVIKNDPEGFYNYLTAPNIRHKVKHPVFLAIKFSNCVQILYNSELLENMNTKLLIENLQKKLLKENKSKPKNQNGFMGNPNEKTFIFLVQNMNDSLKKKKVMESIQTMENSAIGIIYEKKDLNASFINIGDPDSLIKAYRQSYENLLEQCKKYEPSDSEEQSSQEEEEISERSIKKVHVDECPKTITRSGGNPPPKKSQINGFDKNLLKKEESDHLQEPKFFPPTLNEIGSKKGSAFNRAVGFKTIPAQNSQNSEHKNSEKNANFHMNKPEPIRMIHSMSQQDQNTNQPENKGLQNLISNNMMLSNWLNSVKNNNVNLYYSMTGNDVTANLLNQNPMDRFGNRNQPRGQQNPYQVNEQLQCLMQQVNLYRELLAQITYQNALLGGRTYPSSQSNPSQQPSGMNYPPEMLHNMLSSMSSLNPLGGGGLGLSQLHGLGGLRGLGGLSGLNLSGLGGNLNIPNMGGQGMSPGGMGSQGFPPQGMGSGLGGMLPSLQSMQALQALQSLGGMMGPGSFSSLGGQQMASNLSINEILRSQYEQMKEQEKRGREDGNK